MRRFWLLAGLAACQFESPGYDGTDYACAPDSTCPPGYVCRDGRCTGDPAPGAPDAAVEEAPPDAAEPGVTSLRFDAADDTTIQIDAPTTNNADLDFLEIDADPPKVTLMIFDLSAIPPGAVVLSARFDATVFDPIESGTFQLYPLLESWTEDGATWIEREPGVLWTTPGAGELSTDRTAPIAELAADTIEPITMPLDTGAVQAWVSSPAANHGFAIISTSPDGRGGQLRSSEYVPAGERPSLTVTFRD